MRRTADRIQGSSRALAESQLDGREEFRVEATSRLRIRHRFNSSKDCFLYRAKTSCLIVLCGAGLFGKSEAAQALQYEVEGVIEQTLLIQDRKPKVKSDFKVFVIESGWLIETMEGMPPRPPALKRTIGSVNGAEIFEVVTPLEQEVTNVPTGGNASAPATRRRKIPSFDTATAVSNAVPVGQMDSSVIGHLWLMLASQRYLGTDSNHWLTPVYDSAASAPGNPDLKREAVWELMGSPGTLPKEVVYFAHSGDTSAVYRVTGLTNVNGTSFPTGFEFRQYRTGSGSRIYKQATAVITAIRPTCSRASLLPGFERLTGVTDRRLAQSAQPVKVMNYGIEPGGKWESVEVVKRRLDLKQNPARHSVVVVALLMTFLSFPLLFGVAYLWRQRRKNR
jgi:hypothetical protein